jgi:hypothetical protein
MSTAAENLNVVRTYEVEWLDSSHPETAPRFSRVAVGSTSTTETSFSDITRILQIKNGVAERHIVPVSVKLIATQVV